jgi:hypothetical protein
LGLLEIPLEAFPNLGPKCKTCAGSDQNLTKLFLDYFGDKRLQFVD